MRSQQSRTQTRAGSSDPVILHLRHTQDSEQAAQGTEGSDSRPRVRWTTDVVDNENMDKKKSKICCIFHPQREFGESSDEEGCDSSGSSDSSDESDASDTENKNSNNHGNNHENHHGSLDHRSEGSSAVTTNGSDEACCHHKKHKNKNNKKDSTHKHKKASTPNAYERQPQYKNRSTLPPNAI